MRRRAKGRSGDRGQGTAAVGRERGADSRAEELLWRGGQRRVQP